jgi:hypothetical protein
MKSGGGVLIEAVFFISTAKSPDINTDAAFALGLPSAQIAVVDLPIRHKAMKPAPVWRFYSLIFRRQLCD